MLSKLSGKWYLKILILGLLIRVILMPITLHPDLWGHTFTAYFFAYEGKLNVYEYMVNLPKDHPILTTFSINDIFIYPPLAYFSLGFFRLAIKPFVDPNFVPFVMSHMADLYSRNDLKLNIFLYKLPYIFFDLGLGFMISNFFTDIVKKKKALILWILNPVTLYATFMIGQFDILPVFFVVLSFLLVAKNKPYWAMLSLGIGGSYKIFPLLFILPLAFVLTSNFKQRIKYIIAGFLPFILIILPFMGSSAFRQMVLFSPKSQKMLFMGFPVSGAEVLFPFVILLCLFYFYLYYFKNKFEINNIFIFILLLIFSITHYHPQWFLWITPFFIIDLLKRNSKHWELVAILLGCWFIIIMMFDQTLNIGLFNPLNESLSYAAPVGSFIHRYFDVNLLKSLVRSIFAGTSIFYLYILSKEDKILMNDK